MRAAYRGGGGTEMQLTFLKTLSTALWRSDMCLKTWNDVQVILDPQQPVVTQNELDVTRSFEAL